MLHPATQPFLQAGSMAPLHLLQGPAGDARGGQRRACSRADPHIAGGLWPGARLVGEVALRTWRMAWGWRTARGWEVHPAVPTRWME